MSRLWIAALLSAALAASEGVANEVVTVARSYADGGGYNRTWSGSGVPEAIRHGNATILAAGQGGTYCCGYTFAVAMRVAAERGLLDWQSADAVRRFQKQWYGVPEGSRETLCQMAVVELGVGGAVSHDDARPGDFVQFWRSNGSGHSVVFLDWELEADRRVGLRYRSSQGTTDGIGDVTERFADAGGRVVRDRTYFCRLNQRSDVSEVERHLRSGRFAEAEAALRRRVDNAEAPVTGDAAIRLEVLRRTRIDFSLTAEETLSRVRARIPAATLDDVERWRQSGDLESRVIDGQPRFFRRAVPNLFRVNAEARRRRTAPAEPEGDDAFRLTDHLAELVARTEATGADEALPMRHRVRYTLSINADCRRLRPGAVVEAWLPFPQEYGAQRGVRLIAAGPGEPRIAPNGAAHRTAYFRETLGEDARPPEFTMEFAFVNAGVRPRLEPGLVEPYDTESERFREFTADRPPHLPRTAEVERLAAEIVGDATNPLEKARRVFRWVSENLPWVSEKEYSIIPSLCEEGLSARRGDCGVQGAVFITLCRAAGVPARWQSGWQLQPGRVNLHDWSEIYLEPWGWLPVDASYGVRKHDDPRVRDALCGGRDAYRMIVNLDYGRPFTPPKTSFRSEPIDFQRGEVEIDDHNLYFDEWRFAIHVDSTPVVPGETANSSLRGGLPDSGQVFTSP